MLPVVNVGEMIYEAGRVLSAHVNAVIAFVLPDFLSASLYFSKRGAY